MHKDGSKMKYRLIIHSIYLLVTVAIFSSFLPKSVLAFGEENIIENKSNAGVGFYGEYQYPEESDIVQSNSSDEYSSSGMTFPKTGEINRKPLQIMGGFIILVLSVTFILKQKKQIQNREVERKIH